MKVDGVVNQSARQIVFNIVDDNGRPYIDELDVGHILIFLYGLVYFFIVVDPLHKVLCGDFWVLSDVVWRGGFHFANIVHDEFSVVAFRFNEERLDPSRLAHVADPLAASLGRIGCVKYCHLSSCS